MPNARVHRTHQHVTVNANSGCDAQVVPCHFPCVFRRTLKDEDTLLGSCFSEGSGSTLLQSAHYFQSSMEYGLSNVQIRPNSGHFMSDVAYSDSLLLRQLNQHPVQDPGLYARALTPVHNATKQHPPSLIAPSGTAGCDDHIVPDAAVELELHTAPTPEPHFTEDHRKYPYDSDSLSLDDHASLSREADELRNQAPRLDNLPDCSEDQGLHGIEGDRTHQQEGWRQETHTEQSPGLIPLPDEAKSILPEYVQHVCPTGRVCHLLRDQRLLLWQRQRLHWRLHGFAASQRADVKAHECPQGVNDLHPHQGIQSHCPHQNDIWLAFNLVSFLSMLTCSLIQCLIDTSTTAWITNLRPNMTLSTVINAGDQHHAPRHVSVHPAIHPAEPSPPQNHLCR